MYNAGYKSIYGSTGEISGEGGSLGEMSSYVAPCTFPSFKNTFLYKLDRFNSLQIQFC